MSDVLELMILVGSILSGLMACSIFIYIELAKISHTLISIKQLLEG